MAEKHETRTYSTGGFHWYSECTCGWKSTSKFLEREAKREGLEHEKGNN